MTAKTKDELKIFKVVINIDTIYYAESKEECERLVSNDFKGLDCSDDVEIEEIK